MDTVGAWRGALARFTGADGSVDGDFLIRADEEWCALVREINPNGRGRSGGGIIKSLVSVNCTGAAVVGARFECRVGVAFNACACAGGIGAAGKHCGAEGESEDGDNFFHLCVGIVVIVMGES